MTQHDLRWKKEGDGVHDAYDPLHPDGPWTVMCTCGVERQVRHKVVGKTWHEFHQSAHEGYHYYG